MLGSGGIWFQSPEHQQMAKNQYHKMQEKVHTLEALAKNAAVKAHLMKDEPPLPTRGAGGASGGGVGFFKDSKMLALFVALDVLVVVIGALIWFFFIRKKAPPIVVTGAGSLTFNIIRATDLPNTDNTKVGSRDLTDAYVDVKVRGVSKKTPTVKDSLNPQWKAQLAPFEINFDDKKTKHPQDDVVLTVEDHDGMFSKVQVVGDLHLNSAQLVEKILQKNYSLPPGQPFPPYPCKGKLQNVHSDPKQPPPKEDPKLEFEITWAPHKNGKRGINQPQKGGCVMQ